MGISNRPAVDTSQPPITADDVIEELQNLLPNTSIRPDSDLFSVGFDSLRIMRFAGLCRKAGFDISFADFLEKPEPAAWAELLNNHAPSTQAPSVTTPSTAPEAATPADNSGTSSTSDDASPFRLAPLQHAYWAGGYDTDKLGGVSAHLYVELDGPDHEPDTLQAALDTVVARHDMLRVKILNDGTQKVQAQPDTPIFSSLDLRDTNDATVAATLEDIRSEMSGQRAAADLGRMIDVRLTRLPGGRARLHVDFDMLAGDAMSYRIVLDDLAAVLTGEELAPISSSFREYLDAPEVTSPKNRERDQQWWAEQLATLPDPPKLPTYTGVPAHSVRPQRRHLFLDERQRAALEHHAQDNGVTPAACLATAFAEAIGSFTTESRFLLNVPLFHRQQILPDIDRVVGDFSSSVLVTVDVSQEQTVLDRIRAVSESMHGSMRHSDWSALDILRDMSRSRGSQVIAPIVYTSAVGLGELFSARVRSVFGDPVWILSEGPQVLLDAQVTELDGGFLANWDVREGMFLPGVVDAMFEAYRANVDLLVQDAEWASAPFPSAVPEEQNQARRDTETTAPLPEDALLHRRFFDLADTHPDRPAVLWGEHGVRTYAELRDDALRVATSLRKHGVAPGDIVGVRIAKGPHQLTALLGVLAAGAAWVPLGADQPATRRSRILERADATVVLHDTNALSDPDEGITGVLLDDALTTDLPEDAAAQATTQSPDDVVYVLFTSGSTGEPKGVELTHRAVMNTINAVNEIVGLTANDRTLGLSSLEFDLSVHDMFGPLNVGGAVVTLTEQERRDAEAWIGLMTRHHVTQLYCVPPLLDMLLSSTSTTQLDKLRWCLLGGDWVTLDLPGRLRERAPQCRFAGLGGATETAIHSTFFEVTDPEAIDPIWGSVPFGSPLPNMRARIVDDAGRIRPDFAPGEYLVSGPGIARGYRHDAEMTDRKFPTIDGARWYRTNDLARYLPGGCIEFLGRRDDQVKIRGYRIEIGEVEAALRQAPGVHSCVAVVSRPAGDPRDGSAHLGAVIAAGSNHAPDLEEQVRAFLGETLPPYMIPDLMVIVEAIPVNKNGKSDREYCAQLIDTARRDTVQQSASEPPTPGTLEHLVAGVFAEVIGVPESVIGLDDDFIQVGGDSVLTTKAASVLRDVLDDPSLPAVLLFESRTPRSVAASLREVEAEPGLFDRTAAIVHELDNEGL